MAKYEINENVKKNIATFLARLTLSGAEVSAFNEVCNVLNNPIEEEAVVDIEKVKEEPKNE